MTWRFSTRQILEIQLQRRVTQDSTYETETEDEGHLNTSQYKRLVWPVLHEQFMSETL